MSVGDVKSELRQFVRLTRAARSSAERDDAMAGFGVAMTTLIAEEGWARVAAFIPTATEPPILDTLATLVVLLDVVPVSPAAVGSTANADVANVSLSNANHAVQSIL